MKTHITNKKHAKLSPSATKRFMTCPGSVQLIKKVNPNNVRTSSRFAAEGTVAHEIGDLCLATQNTPHSYIGQTFTADGFDFKVTEEMADAVKVYVDYVYDIAHKYDARIESEVWGSLTHLGVDGLTGGTTDARIIAHKHKKIFIIDYKHGMGVSVDAVDNTQMQCYALSGINHLTETFVKLKGWSVIMVIVQPRAFHPDGPIREWKQSAQDTLDWGENVLKPAGLATMDDNPTFKASTEGCRFCEAMRNCPTMYKQTQELAIVDFDDLVPAKKSSIQPVETLSVDAKINILEQSDNIKRFLTAVAVQIDSEMQAGSDEYAGHFKLVKKITRRTFNDGMDDTDFSPILDVLDDDAVFTKKLNGIDVIEKALAAKLGKAKGTVLMGSFTCKPEGDIIVVKDSDRRRAVAPAAQIEFADMKDDNPNDFDDFDDFDDL